MSSSTNKVVKAGAAYTIGNIFLKGIAFLTLPIFSRILTEEEFGIFNLYISYETILTIFVGLCIFGSLRTAIYDYKDNFNQYITSSLVLSGISFGAILILANLGFPLFSKYFEFDRFLLNVLIIHSYAMFVFQFYNTRLALEFRFKEYLLASGVNSIVGTAVSIVLIMFAFDENKYIGRIYGYAFIPIIIAAVILFGFFRTAVKEKHKLVSKEQWKYGISISLPLVVHTFSQQVLNQFDRIMISKLVSNAANGIYSFIHTISNILHIIVLSMDNAWSVWFYQKLNTKDYAQIKNRAKAYILLMNILYIGFISLSPEVIRLAGDKEYYVGVNMIIPLAFGEYFVFLYSLPVHIEYFYKKTKFIALGTSGAAIMNFVLNYVCIINFGYQAAAWTTLCSFILLFVFHWFISRRIDKTPMFPGKMIILSILTLSIYSAWILINIDTMWIRYVSMVGILAAMLIICRKTVIPMMGMVPILKKFVKGK